jgi:hypothetical protein
MSTEKEIEDLFDKAKKRKLPQGFFRWYLGDLRGRIVAHEALKAGYLPEEFDRWELADNDGWTVAHEAAMFGNLPSDFNLFDLSDKNGKTVRDVASDPEHYRIMASNNYFFSI